MGLRLYIGIGTAVAVACAIALWALPAGSTFGQPRISLQLARGALTVSAPPVSAVAGRAVQVTVTVTDARGTGAGWTLKLSALKAVSAMRVSASCAARSTCTLPSASGIGTSPVVLRSRARSGMGVMKLTVTLGALRSGPSVPVKFAVTG